MNHRRRRKGMWRLPSLPVAARARCSICGGGDCRAVTSLPRWGQSSQDRCCTVSSCLKRKTTKPCFTTRWTNSLLLNTHATICSRYTVTQNSSTSHFTYLKKLWNQLSLFPSKLFDTIIFYSMPHNFQNSMKNKSLRWQEFVNIRGSKSSADGVKVLDCHSNIIITSTL